MVERVTNGTFDSDISSWTEAVATLAWVSAFMRMTGFGATLTTARQSFTSAPNSVHNFSIDIDALTGSDQVTINIGTSAGATDIYDGAAASGQWATTGTKTFTFTPTGTTTWLDVIANDTLSDSHTVDVDNISITGDAMAAAVDTYISFPRPRTQEGSYMKATAYFRDGDTAAIPATARYRVDGLTSGKEIVAWTTLTVAASINIDLTQTMMKIEHQSNREERKQLTVEANFDTATATRDARILEVKNIVGLNP